MDISIVIPAYNGGNAIRDLFLKIRDELSGKYSFEVLFIFDHGMVSSWRIIEGLKIDFPDLIRAYHLSKNYGQHRAIQFGFGEAMGNFVITMDEDLQHDPSDIIRLMYKQKEADYDIVYGKFNNLQHHGIRNCISKVLRKTLKKFIPSLYDNYSPYRIIKKEIALRTSTMVCPYTFIDDFLSRITKNIAFEDISHYKRPQGESAYSFAKLIKHGIFILLAYSRIVSWLLVSSIVSILVGSLLFIAGNSSQEILNYIPTINIYMIVAFGAGGILIFLSLIGSFINHHNTLVNTRPVKLL